MYGHYNPTMPQVKLGAKPNLHTGDFDDMIALQVAVESNRQVTLVVMDNL